MNVILASVGRRNYLVRFFREALGPEGRVIGLDASTTAPALRECHRSHVVPPVSDRSYIDRLVRIAEHESVTMIFSLNDVEIGVLVENRDYIEATSGATVYAPGPTAWAICSDKFQTWHFAVKHGLRSPSTYLGLADTSAAITNGQLAFPLIVKPRFGSASNAIHLVETMEDLVPAFNDCAKWGGAGHETDSQLTASAIAQELVDGKEYGLDVLFSRQGQVLGYAAREKLAMRAGETDKAISVAPDMFEPFARELGSHLDHRGNLDCDILERDGDLYLLEINPRFGGGYPFTHLAGANHVAMLINDYVGTAPSPYGYEPGLTFAKYDMLVDVTPPRGDS